MSTTRAVRRLALSVVAVAAFVGLLGGSRDASAGRFHEAPVRGALAYEGVRAAHASPFGVETELTACTASVIELPGIGPKLVTARHCDGRDEAIFDERARVRPAWRHELTSGGPDVAVLDLERASPWQPLVVRASSTLQRGEPLCAFHVSRESNVLQRSEVCAPFLGRTFRLDGGAPRLVVGHAYAHGTSGSPLVDQQGRVVGIVVSTTDEAGFAEPIEEAVRVARAPAISARLDPPAIAARAPLLRGFFPNEGSLCLRGLCLRWEM